MSGGREREGRSGKRKGEGREKDGVDVEVVKGKRWGGENDEVRRGEEKERDEEDIGKSKVREKEMDG